MACALLVLNFLLIFIEQCIKKRDKLLEEGLCLNALLVPLVCQFSLESAEKLGRSCLSSVCAITCALLYLQHLTQRTLTYLDKYLLQFGQIQFEEIHFASCFAFSKYQGWAVYSRPTHSTQAYLPTTAHFPAQHTER